MNEQRACFSVSGAFLLAALLGTSPLVHAQQDAARATPPRGKALVFVFRNDRETVAAQVPVFVNLARAGDLANGTFVVATVNPGRTFLRIGDQALSMSTLEAVANQSYFVQIEALGVRPVRTNVRLVSEIDGRRLLAQSRLVGPAPAGFAAAPRPQPPAAPIAAPRPRPPAPLAAPPRVQPPPPVAAAPRVQPPPPAKPAPRPAPREIARRAEPQSDWNVALIASTGAFKMSNGSQTVAGLDSTYDKTSRPVFGIEAELRNRGGFAVGGEAFYYKNDLVANGTSLSAQQQVIAIMANGRYYFRAANRFFPFAGAGIGFGYATYGGNLAGSAGGLAYQGLVGMEYRFESVGLRVEYKYLAATTGKSGNEVKVGGSGILAGVSIAF